MPFRLIAAVPVLLFIASFVDVRHADADEGKINLLVLSSNANKVPLIDPAYESELKAAGYNVVVMALKDHLTMDFVRQFGVVIAANLPYSGEEFTVYGYKNRFVEPNLKLLREYVQLGGGLVVMPAISEFGEAYGWTYNDFLEDWGASLLIQQLKNGESAKNQSGPGSYGVGVIRSGHPVAKGLEGDAVLYPMNVMRWDHSYSCTPIITNNEWTKVAVADGAKTYGALDNSTVGEALTDNNTLYAVRSSGKGNVAVSAIHSYYTLTRVSSKLEGIGENNTGVIDFKVIRGEKDGRPSSFGKLLDNTFRTFAANSVKHGLGKWQDIPQPENPPYPQSDAIVNWHTQKTPPTWQHRVIPSKEWPRRYDELPDPGAAGPMKFWKMLVGPRTAYSSGKGTVAEYKAAAIKAGYSAITFCETFEELTPKAWASLLADCRKHSDDNFVCLPGLDIESYEGQRYLVLGAERYPSPNWLTPDGKRLQAVRMLSLGWFGHISVVHRPNHGALHHKTYKHYAGIAVATYDTRGKLVDDGFDAYHWSAASDSSPIPIAVHEVMKPADVANATRGFQQIMPAPTLSGAIKYFRFAFGHVFDAPVRYFISEGPILDGWSMFNKDIGKAEYNRRQFRFGISVKSPDQTTAIKEIKVYDGFDQVRRWTNDQPMFQATVDGSHGKQHQFLLVATDASGRRVVSPALRTVCNNYRARCGDRQNWLGTQIVYTCWHSNGLPTYRLELEGSGDGVLGRESPTLLDFPFYSNHVQVQEADYGYRFVNGQMEVVAGDAKGMLPLRPTDTVTGKVRYTYFNPIKNRNVSAMVVDTRVTLRKPASVTKPTRSVVNPVFVRGLSWNNQLIMPNQQPEQLGTIMVNSGRPAPGDPDNALTALPIGSYAGGVIPLTEGLHVDDRQIGILTQPGSRPAGTEWHGRYVLLRPNRFHWKTNRSQSREVVDPLAEQALAEMGFRGFTPYELKLHQGSLSKTAYFAHLQAHNGGVAGKCINESGKPLLMYVPFLIDGLNTQSEMVLWRSDHQGLEPFAAFEGQGYVSFDADKTVDFYAGNAAVCDPRLTISMVIWDSKTAWFRIHNPTDQDIESVFTTAKAVKNHLQINQAITVPSGSSIQVKVSGVE